MATSVVSASDSAETYRAKYAWTYEEILVVIRNNPYARRAGAVLNFFRVVTVFLAIVFTLTIQKPPPNPGSPTRALLWWSIAIYLCFLHRPVINWWIRRRFRKNGSPDRLIHLEFTPDRWRFEIENVEKLEVYWKALTEAIEGPDGFLLFTGNGQYVWIPFYAFEVPEGAEKVREFIKANGVKFKTKNR